MKALTLWRPWSDAIVHGPKRVENRPWCPPATILGELIAIHAGMKYGIAEGWSLPGDYSPPDEDESPTGIVGVARVMGYLDLRKGERRGEIAGGRLFRLGTRIYELDTDPWWLGPVGWLLEDVVALPKPLACPGALGLWRVPVAIDEQIVEALAA